MENQLWSEPALQPEASVRPDSGLVEVCRSGGYSSIAELLGRDCPVHILHSCFRAAAQAHRPVDVLNLILRDTN